MGKNTQRLGEVLSSRMTKTAGAAVPTTVELGTISSNRSLITDSLKVPIPRGDYMVNLMLASTAYETSEESIEGTVALPDGGEELTVENEPHSHQLPLAFRNLKPGDRVLVIWCGYEPVVAAIVVSS